ncbi:hypothetical protein MSG28_002459 [Choristoneura fumiferana]|uniref:Uncharacterized protein n=1 Tax=Choristoneura fumiferana TaxID=7141 RepID=A0ACC0JVT7_CHOFU|nr:hypothetical protein MSG28_002459 [Choristoneura fumiferana]
MSLECVDEPNTSGCQSKTDDSWTSVLTDTDYSEASDSEGELEVPDVTTAKAYIMQYSDYTHKAIEAIVAPQIKGGKKKPKTPKVNQIIKDIKKGKSVIIDNVALSSSDEESDEECSNHSKTNNEAAQQRQTAETMEDLVSTQASVLFVENDEPSVISLDSSLEEAVEKEKEMNCMESIQVKDSESSDDDEFEEVPEVENKSSQPVVELTLNIDNARGDDDDIFADIFAPKFEPNSINVSNIRSDIKNKTELEHFVPKVEPSDTSNKLEDKSNVCVSIDHMHIKNINPTDPVRVENIVETTLERSLTPNKTLQNVDSGKASNNLTIDLPEKPKTSEETVTHVNPDLINDPAPVESNKPPKEPLTEEQLNTMAEEIQNEEQDLMQEKGRLDRIGRNITEQMTKEAQELLQIFGIPYVVAPMEAEAQCAFLESVKLTDGTITDDSDIWLFGDLTREQLILLALLVGSDYTTGVAGVGPVTAMEILASFPFNKKQVLAETSKQVKYAKLLDGLKEFKLWVRAGKRTDNTSLKKKLRNVTLTDDFPSMRVIQAYLEPNVERSEEKFTWGELDITVLRDYAKSKFGWSQNKFDEIIKPVLARMKDRKNQKTVHDYFQRKVEFQTLEDQMSKRVKAAVQKMGPGGCLEKNPDSEESSKKTKKRKQVSKNNAKNEAGSSKPKQKRKEAYSDQVVKVVTEVKDGKSGIEINILKTDRFQEIIPQREKDKQHLLDNKLKAIEIFRKTTIDRKRKIKKRKANLPKEDAGLSESSDSE